MTRTHCDVLVVGGGLVGATAALALARAGRRVVLLDRAEPQVTRGRLGFDVRTVALNAASADLLGELGVFASLAGCPFDRVHVCEELGTRYVEFSAAEVDRHELGWIIEVSPAVDTLWRVLRGEPRAQLVLGSIDAVAPAAAAVEVAAGEERITAALLIAADGAQSSVRRLLGVAAARFETGQAAIATVIETERPHEGIAWQCFRRDGPLALLPLPPRDGRHFCSVVWSQSEVVAAAAMREDDAAFVASLERASGHRLGVVRAVDARFCFPLEQRVAASFQPVPRVLLIGDAARVLHPLAGQGVNLGFEDVREVQRVALRVEPQALGDAELWRGFARRRELRAQLMVRAMDAFANAYRLADPGLAWLRNMAVQLLNDAPPLKRQLIREALGYGILAPPQ
jgi:2-polyprenylphenol 6-hydroxylase